MCSKLASYHRDPAVLVDGSEVGEQGSSFGHRLLRRRIQPAQLVNVDGTANLVTACDGSRIRFVYLSTDYVYKGDRGNYSESDEVVPFNLYSATKLSGEEAVRRIPNHPNPRTRFGANKFVYTAAS